MSNGHVSNQRLCCQRRKSLNQRCSFIWRPMTCKTWKTLKQTVKDVGMTHTTTSGRRHWDLLLYFFCRMDQVCAVDASAHQQPQLAAAAGPHQQTWSHPQAIQTGRGEHLYTLCACRCVWKMVTVWKHDGNHSDKYLCSVLYFQVFLPSSYWINEQISEVSRLWSW